MPTSWQIRRKLSARAQQLRNRIVTMNGLGIAGLCHHQSGCVCVNSLSSSTSSDRRYGPAENYLMNSEKKLYCPLEYNAHLNFTSTAHKIEHITHNPEGNTQHNQKIMSQQIKVVSSKNIQPKDGVI